MILTIPISRTDNGDVLWFALRFFKITHSKNVEANWPHAKDLTMVFL